MEEDINTYCDTMTESKNSGMDETIVRQRHGKQDSLATLTHAIAEELLELVIAGKWQGDDKL
jgi:hypothetical protein